MEEWRDRRHGGNAWTKRESLASTATGMSNKRSAYARAEGAHETDGSMPPPFNEHC